MSDTEIGRAMSVVEVQDVSHTRLAEPAWSALRTHLVPAGLVLAAVLLIPCDMAISRLCYKQADGRPKLLRTVLDNTEPFGHSVGIVVVAVAVFCLDGRRKRGWTVIAAGLGSGLVAAALKLTVSRTRPRNFTFEGDIWNTFHGWLPLLDGGSHGQSLPSAHTATAVGAAVALCAMYPRGRWLFVALTVLVAGHRLHSGAHFPSDILLGAAVGWLAGTYCVRQLEQRTQPTATQAS